MYYESELGYHGFYSKLVNIGKSWCGNYQLLCSRCKLKRYNWGAALLWATVPLIEELQGNLINFAPDR